MAKMKHKGRNKTCSICGDPIPDLSPEELVARGYWRLGSKNPHRMYFSYYMICPKHSGKEVGDWIGRTYSWIKGEGGTTNPPPPRKREMISAIHLADEQLVWIVDELERRLTA